ncbi:aromatic acid exporter family protein [Microbacterium sp. ARD32]|uniref:FUSC family protein n=1 Tax=Microbacterium sp. ARD32 TaxID=2962577 RepID=UPI002882C8F1|nr:FUSC family protein [Microbacterium sp. ARD32]MDT0156232.1 aromatic acid exporter family protein [Microbacterium sp. ARD32]
MPRRGIAQSLRDAVTPARLLLAAKTAAAVGIAWLVAPLMPGVTDDYPYYGPFGALISMYPTLMSSARSSLQTLLGLAVGAGLAAVVVLTVGPNLWTIVGAVGLGTLISGTGWFGAAREYIPVAALFVLIVGGSDGEDYSLGYVTQTAVGIVIGLGINLAIPPAPLGAEAIDRIDAFQHRLATHLDDIADAVADSWPPEHSSWDGSAGALAETSRSLRAALAEADESRRWNPRAVWRHLDTGHAHERLETLDEIAHQIRDIAGCLGDTIWERPGALPLDPPVVEPLSTATHAVATALGDDQDEALREQASQAVEALTRVVHTRSIDTDAVTGPGVLTAMHLQRVLVLLGRGPEKEQAA